MLNDVVFSNMLRNKFAIEVHSWGGASSNPVELLCKQIVTPNLLVFKTISRTETIASNSSQEAMREMHKLVEMLG